MHEYGYFYDAVIKLFLHIFLPHKILETSLMIHYELDLIQSASFLIRAWFKLLVLQIGYCKYFEIFIFYRIERINSSRLYL